MSKTSGKYLEKLTSIDRGILGKSDSHLILNQDTTIVIPKPKHARNLSDFKSKTSKRSASIDLMDKKIDSSLLSDFKRRIVFSDYFDDESTREVCDEIQNIIQNEKNDTINLKLDVLSYVDFFEPSFNDLTDQEFSGYSITPPSRATNPLVANSAFSEDRFEVEGAELGIFSISPPMRSPSHWDTN